MIHRTLGTSGLLVPPISLGTMTFGTPVAEADAIRIIHEAIDRGVTFLDTANVYEGYARYLGSAGGVAEEIVGKAIHDRRARVVLTTKVGAPVGPGPQDRGLSRVHLLRELDMSLRRLRTDSIDLYMAHWPDRLVPLDTLLETIDLAVQQGKVRHFGVSNHYGFQLAELLAIAQRDRRPRVVASQVPLSLLRRELHNDLRFCADHQIAVTPYQPLQGGLLTGKYRRGQAAPEGSRGAEKPEWMWKQDELLYNRLERLEWLAQQHGHCLARYAMAWALAQPAVASLVVGVKCAEQLDDAIAAADIRLTHEELREIDAICPPPWSFPDPVRG